MICPHCNKETSLKKSNPAEWARRKSENVKRTLALRKLNGTTLGRPRTYDYERIIQLRGLGLSYSAIAGKLRCPVSTIQRALGRIK